MDKELLVLNGGQIDPMSELKMVKASRGVAVFIKQLDLFDEDMYLYANKAISHEQAIQMRDFLIENYPLESNKDA